MPANMPKSLQELRIHENEITKIKKASFQGMSHVIVMGMKMHTLADSFRYTDVEVWLWVMVHIVKA